LIDVISTQRSTILKKDPGIPRESMSRISELVGLPHIIVITGLRRCGKSTLLRQIIQSYYRQGDFYYINFEDERLRNFCSEDFNIIYEVQLRLFGEHKVFLIDEIQNVEGFELFVRRFHEMGFKFFITGSNATLLSRELGTKLTGRYLRIDLTPFSFKEFLDMKGISHDRTSLAMTESRVIVERAFDVYIESGGMPEFLKYEDREILLRVYDDIVLKDIVVRYGLENTAMIKDLYGYLISNLSNRFTYNSLRKTVGAGSTTTIQNYIHYLEEANFCRIIHLFDPKVKMQIMSSKKFYLTDHGFLGPISSRLSRNRGKVLENIILSTIAGKGDVFYFQGKNECDFIIVESQVVTSAIQVTYDLNDETRDREIAGMIEALDAFGLEEGTIVTHSQNEEIEVRGKRIMIVPAWKWCLSH